MKIICSYIVFAFFGYSDLLIILKDKNMSQNQGKIMTASKLPNNRCPV